MAVAVSTFYTPRASVDGFRSTNPPSPIVEKHTNSFKFPHFSTYAGQVYDGLSQRRRQIKSLLSNDGIKNNAQVSQGFLHGRVDHVPPTSTSHISYMPGIETEKDIRPRSPFRKWMVSIQKRNKHSLSSRRLPSRDQPYWLWGTGEGQSMSPPCYSIRAKASSGSSFNFVSAVRSASVSLAGLSTITRSRANTAISRCASQVDHGTEILAAEPKQSADMSIDRPIRLDPDALDRAVKRRRILDELVHTEQDYISDIRLLLNVYVTMLVSLPSTYPGLRQSVNQNLSDILQLHEEFLDELQRAVSHSEIKEFGHPEGAAGTSGHPLHDRTQAHCRGGGGADLHRGRSIMEISELCAEPQVIVEVSKIFERQMSRFFIYKEYGAKYEMMIREIASVYDRLPDWDWNQKGLEALSALLSTRSCAQRNTNRAATMKDLLVKPIQRICRYPLIFAELLKYTPVADCPNAHMAAESVLARFREATTEINQVTNDPQMRITLSRSWLLQDRLVFPNRSFDSVSKDRVRSFGHVRLCGTLHVCWQTPDGVDGQYLICILYPDVLCLACAGKVDPIYTINACINVHDVKIEEADNGRGLQCHTAPFSWKLVFECHHQLFEIIMTACAPKEEVEWRARLSSPLTQCKIGVTAALTFLDLDIKSLGVVASKSDPGARRLSIRRATTICPKPALYQVIIKNTSGVRQTSGHGPTPLNIHRSHSLLAAKTRVSFLAPPRSERARLEVILADVWSQEILPFSGMGGRSRSERLVRTSASTVIRKLSVASIASSFAKRASGLRQRMSLEDTFRPVGPQTTPSHVAELGSASNWGNRMSDLEKQKALTAAGKRSWSQEEMQGTTKKRSGISGHGFRGMFS